MGASSGVPWVWELPPSIAQQLPRPQQVVTMQGWGQPQAAAPTPLLSALISRNIPTSVTARQPAPSRQSPRKRKHILAAPCPSFHKVTGTRRAPQPHPRAKGTGVWEKPPPD